MFLLDITYSTILTRLRETRRIFRKILCRENFAEKFCQRRRENSRRGREMFVVSERNSRYDSKMTFCSESNTSHTDKEFLLLGGMVLVIQVYKVQLTFDLS